MKETNDTIYTPKYNMIHTQTRKTQTLNIAKTLVVYYICMYGYACKIMYEYVRNIMYVYIYILCIAFENQKLHRT